MKRTIAGLATAAVMAVGISGGAAFADSAETAKEVQQLGGQDVQTGTRVVTFSGDKGFMYKANLSLRTALKILKPIKWFKVFNDKSLYDGISSIDWSQFIERRIGFT